MSSHQFIAKILSILLHQMHLSTHDTGYSLALFFLSLCFAYFLALLFLSAHFLVIQSGMDFKLAIFSQNLSVKSEMISSVGLALAAMGTVAFLS